MIIVLDKASLIFGAADEARHRTNPGTVARTCALRQSPLQAKRDHLKLGSVATV